MTQSDIGTGAPPKVAALAGELLPRAQVYLTGSHAYGLQVPESDQDWVIIYHDAEDRRRVFRRHPEVKHDHTNDTKLYALDKFARNIEGGSPELTELAGYMLPEFPGAQASRDPAGQARADVVSFMQFMRPFLVTRSLAAGYRGMLQQLLGQLDRYGPAPKRLAHIARLADTLVWTLDDPSRVHQFRLSKNHALIRQIRTGEMPLEEAGRWTQILVREAGARYEREARELPDSTELRDAIDTFFLTLRL